jgi:hypothetical protein
LKTSTVLDDSKTWLHLEARQKSQESHYLRELCPWNFRESLKPLRWVVQLNSCFSIDFCFPTHVIFGLDKSVNDKQKRGLLIVSTPLQAPTMK